VKQHHANLILSFNKNVALTIEFTMSLTIDLLNRITQTPGQCGGRPCIRGMRIRVTDILEMLAENVSVTEILEDFPDLELADIQACLIFAPRRTDFPRLTA
jgi:uncharacterized protein (DUF433 family)